MKKSLAITLLGSCALLLGACTTDLQKSQNSAPLAASEFNRNLSTGYRASAENQWTGQVDFQGSEHFARKSMAAARNETVMPDNIVHNDPVRLEPELIEARARLITALNGGATTRVPASAARAQVYFDCWLDEANDPKLVSNNVDPWLQAKVRNCREGYFTAMNEVDARPVAAATPAPAAAATPAQAPRQQAYITFFDFDQSTVTPEGRNILRAVSDNVRRGGVSDVTLTANADRSGTDDYNMALSKRRAEAVRAILMSNGVPSSVIVTVAKGESQPLISTADGVREPQNRNVAVVIK